MEELVFSFFVLVQCKETTPVTNNFSKLQCDWFIIFRDISSRGEMLLEHNFVRVLLASSRLISVNSIKILTEGFEDYLASEWEHLKLGYLSFHSELLLKRKI